MTVDDDDDKASRLLALHRAPELLTLVNVWDAASAAVVAAAPGTRALATASHAIAASWGYEDGEHIPVETMIAVCGRIVAVTDLPVTADLEAGYGHPDETVRRAIGVGVVGANLEDAMKPLTESVRAVEAALTAAAQEGVSDFVLNARTDAFLTGGGQDRTGALAEAVRRARAYIAAGAHAVFVPGALHEAELVTLVDAVGPHRLSVLGMPGLPSRARLEELGVSRLSYGPRPQQVALEALRAMVEDVTRG